MHLKATLLSSGVLHRRGIRVVAESQPIYTRHTVVISGFSLVHSSVPISGQG